MKEECCEGGAMKESPPVSQQAGGMHPTGMHFCIDCRLSCPSYLKYRHSNLTFFSCNSNLKHLQILYTQTNTT